jgi:23S rRNA pseudouridine1911/1915/1917 synthase
MELPDAALVYLDDALLILAKPPGIPVHATLDPHRDHLLLAATRLLDRRGERASELGLGHRLDVGTSGLIALGRRPDVTAQLAALFAERSVQKVYLALTQRREPLPDAALEVRNHLAVNKDGREPPIVSVRAGGDRAWTTLTVLRASPQAVLWRAELHTGRRHQIRAHLAGLGMPLVGDLAYGSQLAAPRAMLHAAFLALPHPVSGELLRFSLEPPADFQECARHFGIDPPKLDLA